MRVNTLKQNRRKKMENKTTYTSLKQLSSEEAEFTVSKVYSYQWKRWNPEIKRMEISEKWEKGFRKIYGVVTDKGTLDLSANQIANMFESVSKNGEANIISRTFKVKSNGKEGMEIRYFINAKPLEKTDLAETAPSWQAQKEKFETKKQVDDVAKTFDDAEPIDLSSIPF